MAAKDKLAELRNKVIGAKAGKLVTFEGIDLKIIAPTVDQGNRWGSGKAKAAEILRTCVANPDGELLFVKATDKQLDECSLGLVTFATAVVKEMMEDATGNFGSTTTDNPSTE